MGSKGCSRFPQDAFSIVQRRLAQAIADVGICASFEKQLHYFHMALASRPHHKLRFGIDCHGSETVTNIGLVVLFAVFCEPPKERARTGDLP
jgi:hypothetical protein